VQVLCRVRRPLGSELQEQLAIKTDAAARQILLEDKAFTFDHVLDPESTQQHVFERIRPLVTSLLDGYSGCIFAYGQTGAGKTYTMDGTETEPGVYMRSIHELFHSIKQRGGEYTLEMSIFEIYNELIYDLLNLETDPRL
jgi:kinesin family protein C2/C3